MHEIDLTIPRGADVPVQFRMPGVNLTGFSATMFIHCEGVVTPRVMTATWLPGAEPASVIEDVLPHDVTQALPQGALSTYELQITSPSGSQSIVATGTITATGGLNDD